MAETHEVPPKPARRESIKRKIANRLWGYDYFISYHWASGGPYAVALAQRLLDRGYDCFLDRAEYAMGDDWKKEGERALRHTQRLVLIATRDAVTISKPVAREVEIFTARSRHVIPIFFGERFTDSDRLHSEVLRHIHDSHLHIEETPDNLSKGPSEITVEQLLRTGRVLRRRTLRTRIVTAVISVLAVAVVISGIFGLRADRARRAEAKAKEIAQTRLYQSESRRLARDSSDVIEKYPQRGLLLAMEAVNAAFKHAGTVTPAAEQSLRNAILANSGQRIGNHNAHPDRLIISPDGGTLAAITRTSTAGVPKTLSVWTSVGQSQNLRHHVISNKNLSFNDIGFSPNKEFLFAATSDGRVTGWSIGQGSIEDPIDIFASNYELSQVTPSPNGEHLAVAGPGGLWLLTATSFETEIGETDSALQLIPDDALVNTPILSVAFSSDGMHLAAGGPNGMFQLWNLAKNRKMIPDDTFPVDIPFDTKSHIQLVKFSPDGQRLAATSWASEVCRVSEWQRDRVTGEWGFKRLFTIPDPQRGPELLFVGNASLVVSAKIEVVKGVYDRGTVRVRRGDSDWVMLPEARYPIAASPDGYLASGGNQHDILLWELQDHVPTRPTRILTGMESPVAQLAFSPDGRWCYGASVDGAVKRWDLWQHETIRSPVAVASARNGYWGLGQNCQYHFVELRDTNELVICETGRLGQTAWRISGDKRPQDITRYEVAPTGDFIVAVTKDGQCYRLSRSSQPADHWQYLGNVFADYAPIAFSDNGHYLAIVDLPTSPEHGTRGSKSVINIWDNRRDNTLPLAIDCDDIVEKVSLTNNATFLIASTFGAHGAFVKLPRAAKESHMHLEAIEKGGIRQYAISEDATTIAVLDNDSRVWLWQMPQGDLEPFGQALDCNGKAASAIEFIGRQLLVGTRAGGVLLFDTSGSVAWSIQAHDGAVTQIFSAPDQLSFVSCGMDATKLWRLDRTASEVSQAVVIDWGAVRGYSRDSRWLCAEKDGSLVLWHTRLGELLEAATSACDRQLTREEFAQYFPGYTYRATFLAN